MKKLLLLLCFLFFIDHSFIYCQKNTGGYAYLQPEFFIKNGFANKFSINGGVGFTPSKYIGFGAGISTHLFKKDNQFVVGKFDFRPFFVGLDHKAAYYITLQPGYVLYNKSLRVGNVTIKSKGGFALDALLGVIARPPDQKGIGITLNAGYSLLSFETSGNIQRYHGFKIQGGVAF